MSEFTTWEQMSTLEQMASQYWDMYKDAHGFRPRHVDTSGWTMKEFNDEFDYLGRMITDNENQRKINEDKASIDFEIRIQNLQGMGAQDRVMAMRWIHEAEETNGDDEYLCYTLGLPYLYFRKAL